MYIPRGPVTFLHVISVSVQERKTANHMVMPQKLEIISLGSGKSQSEVMISYKRGSSSLIKKTGPIKYSRLWHQEKV